MTRIRLGDLRDALDRVLRDIESAHGPEVDIDADYYYWHLPVASAFDVFTEPASSLRMASLADDVEALDPPVDGAMDQAMLAWHDLAHLAGLLRAIELHCLK